MTSQNPQIELGFDRPLTAKEAIKSDKLGRMGYAQAAVRALARVSPKAGFVLSVEGAWGSGKTSTLALMEAVLSEQARAPIVVHFNPWLIGDRDALLRTFLSRIADEVQLVDHAAEGKKVASELKAYAKVFDLAKLVPGLEPWASLVKTVFEATGKSVDAVSTHKSLDVEAKKQKVEDALCRLEKPIIVFIDDIDRLFPAEVFEMVRIIKAVGDLPNVGYVLAWDPDYVSDALKAAGVPRSENYLDKVVQVRLPLPAIGIDARSTLINEALGRLEPAAHHSIFAKDQDRLRELYFSGLREMLEQPRDYARVFNTVAVIEPALRGEVVLADIVGLATLIVGAPSVYQLLRREPRIFVGRLPSDHDLMKKDDEIIRDGTNQRDSAFSQCRFPVAAQQLAHCLFPLTARVDDRFTIGRVQDGEGRIAAPARLLVALQLHVGGADVSFVAARRYLMHADQRARIASSLTPQNCLAFLECLGDVAESGGARGISDVEQLSLDIARLPDSEPFLTKSRDRSAFFLFRGESVAIRAIRLIVSAATADKISSVAELVVSDPIGLTVALDVFVRSFISDSNEDELRCMPTSRARLAARLGKNIVEAAKAGRLLTSCRPDSLLWGLSAVAPRKCRQVLSAMRTLDPTLDGFALAMLNNSFDSIKGQRYSLQDDRSTIESYMPLTVLKKHARKRLADPMLEFPAKAAWRAVIEEKSIYGIDGSYAKD